MPYREFYRPEVLVDWIVHNLGCGPCGAERRDGKQGENTATGMLGGSVPQLLHLTDGWPPDE